MDAGVVEGLKNGQQYWRRAAVASTGRRRGCVLYDTLEMVEEIEV